MNALDVSWAELSAPWWPCFELALAGAPGRQRVGGRGCHRWPWHPSVGRTQPSQPGHRRGVILPAKHNEQPGHAGYLCGRRNAAGVRTHLRSTTAESRRTSHSGRCRPRPPPTGGHLATVTGRVSPRADIRRHVSSPGPKPGRPVPVWRPTPVSRPSTSDRPAPLRRHSARP